MRVCAFIPLRAFAIGVESAWRGLLLLGRPAIGLTRSTLFPWRARRRRRARKPLYRAVGVGALVTFLARPNDEAVADALFLRQHFCFIRQLVR